jgi:MFS family permease
MDETPIDETGTRTLLDPSVKEVRETKKQFLIVVTGEYLVTGFFWVFLTLGSLVLFPQERNVAAQTLFLSLFVLMFSNGVWEILTGWYADKFRRRFSISAGFLACFVGFCLMGIASLNFGSSADPVFSARSLIWNAGVSIWSLGPALLSGAQEAWLVDRCNYFSKQPPEDVDVVFKKSAAYGVFAKAVGAAVCFVIFFARDIEAQLRKPDPLVFLLSAGIAAVLSAGLFYCSQTLREEYWSHPKYQTNESLFLFLRKSLRDLWRVPFRWFTLSYIGVMSLNYVLSSTVWVYMIKEAAALLYWAVVLIVVEVTGSFLSRPFSKLIDILDDHRLRVPFASLLYLAPIPFMWIYGSSRFLQLLMVATFTFRLVHASVFGSLNTMGQLAIKSDERRAILISMSSALSSFLMSIVFLLFFWFSGSDDQRGISTHVEQFWYYVPLVCIVMLIGGSGLAARSSSEAS